MSVSKLNLFQYSIGIVLLICSVGHFYQQVMEYLSGQISVAESREPHEALLFPLFLICANPPYRPDFEALYGFTFDLNHRRDQKGLELAFNRAVVGNVSLSSLWSQATAQISDYAYQSIFFYDNGEPKFHLPELNVSTIDTLTFGRCLLFNISRSFQPRKWIYPKFLNAPDGAAPLFQVSALSPDQLPRAISGGKYDSQVASISAKQGIVSLMNLERVVAKELQTESNQCVGDEEYNFLSCYKNAYKSIYEPELKKAGCLGICLTPYVWYWLADSNMPNCSNSVDFACASGVAQTLPIVADSVCPKPCVTEHYRGLHYDTQVKDGSTGLSFMYTTGKIFVQTEYYVTHLSTMVGSVGGSISLFLGFSFWMCALSSVKAGESYILMRMKHPQSCTDGWSHGTSGDFSQYKLSAQNRLLFTAALAMLFVLLAVASAGFVYQQISEYFQAKVSIAQAKEEVEDTLFPVIQICAEPPLLHSFAETYGFTMDAYWEFDNTSTEMLKGAIHLGGIRALWEKSTSGIKEFGFLQAKVSNNRESEAVVNPKDLQVILMDTMLVGRCLLVNYTKPVKKGASVSLYFEPSSVLVEFAAYFLDDYDMPAAALDAFFGSEIHFTKVQFGEETTVALQKSIITSLSTPDNTCARNISPVTCANNMYQKAFNKISEEYGCERVCHTPLTGYFQLNSSYPHPSCTTAEEYICSKGVTASFAEVVKELCDMPCTTRAFSGPILRRHSSNQTVLTMTYPSSTVKTQREYYVQTFSGIVGEMGGSLGLFLGFSIWQALIFLVRKVNEACKTTKRKS